MITRNYLSRISGLAVTGLVAGTLSGRATIDMTCTGLSLSATDVGLEKTQTGPTPPVNSFNLPVGGYYIGEYTFTVNGFDATTSGFTHDGLGAEGSGLTTGEKFNSVCLSPSGDLDLSEHSYNFESFSSASPGINPGDWSTYGIQDAAYLWKKFGNTVTSGSQGAGLAEAMYKVLYDGGTGGLISGISFTPLLGSDPTALGAYNSYISNFELNGPTWNAGNEQSLGMLVPNPNSGENPNGGSGQEFILLVPVPEPTTLIAGASLLLPFGAGALRILRKNRVA
jgi:hypothetical protein